MEGRGVLILLPFLCLYFYVAVAQVVIPPKFDGFVYEGALAKKDSIVVEAFFDPVCPDSRDSWPPLKKIIKDYAPNISLTAHLFPLPYHDNAFVASRAIHIADKLNSSSTYPLLEKFFKHQERYYNLPTSEMSRKSITNHIAKFASNVVGDSSLPLVKSGFEDASTDVATRTSFKYGCSRGVTGTPYFFVNGFPLPGGGTPLDYNTWKSLIDPLVKQQ